ncbi:MAG TPA: hypothetical protein VE155_15280 [Pseudonocardiaceae bacterium]|nr:hypothetical protein [Pseudonocardiaceae bacterium]
MAFPRAAREGWVLDVIGGVDFGQNGLFIVVALLLASLFVPGVRDRLDKVTAAAAACAVTALMVNALPTNLGAETFEDVLGMIMTQTHMVAGCTWLGGLASLVLLSRTRPALGRHAGLFWARIWQRFSILALTAVGAVIISGSWWRGSTSAVSPSSSPRHTGGSYSSSSSWCSL